jgi:hypothetical protein
MRVRVDQLPSSGCDNRPNQPQGIYQFSSSRSLVIRQNCIRGHVITLQRVHNGDEDRRAAGLQ